MPYILDNCACFTPKLYLLRIYSTFIYPWYSYSRIKHVFILIINIYISVLYLSIILDLYMFLNLPSVSHIFISISRLFHRLTPCTDIRLCFTFVLIFIFSNMDAPLSSYRLTLFCKSLWTQVAGFFFTLYIICTVLKSTKSLNLSACEFMNNLFVGCR